MSATFLVDDTFEIPGRGLVIVGQILSGTIRGGDLVALPDGLGGVRWANITGVEMVCRQASGDKAEGAVGLLVGDRTLEERHNIVEGIRREPTLSIVGRRSPEAILLFIVNSGGEVEHYPLVEFFSAGDLADEMADSGLLEKIPGPGGLTRYRLTDTGRTEVARLRSMPHRTP